MSAPDSFPFWRRNSRVLAFSAACTSAGFNAPLPYLPLICRELGVQSNLEVWVGLMMGSAFVVSFLVTPVWGAVADHFGKKPMVLRAAWGLSAVYLLLALAPSLPWFFPLFWLMGATNGFLAAAVTLVASNTPRRFIGQAVSLPQTGTLLGSTSGPALAAVLIRVLPSYQALFWMSLGLCITAGTFSLLIVREVRTPPRVPFKLSVLRDAGTLSRRPPMALLWFITFVYGIVIFGNTTVISLFTVELMQTQPLVWGQPVETWLAVTVLSITISSAVAAPMWGRLIDRIHPRRILVPQLAMGALSLAAFAVVRGPAALSAARLVQGLLTSGLYSATVHLTRQTAPPGHEARALSFALAMQLLGNAAGPLGAAAFGPWLGLRAYFLFNAAIMGATMLWCWHSQRRRPAQWLSPAEAA